MAMKWAYVASVALALWPWSASGEPQGLAGDNLRQMVTGKTVVIDTPMGSIPISYRDNGTMTGRAQGMTGYALNPRDSGRWWIKSDQLCQKWQSWLDGRTYCITVRKIGSTVHWRATDGRTGTAMIMH
jgi:hypothetical protein